MARKVLELLTLAQIPADSWDSSYGSDAHFSLNPCSPYEEFYPIDLAELVRVEGYTTYSPNLTYTQNQRPDQWLNNLCDFREFCQDTTLHSEEEIQADSPAQSLARHASISTNRATMSTICNNLELAALHLAVYLTGLVTEEEVTAHVIEIFKNE